MALDMEIGFACIGEFPFKEQLIHYLNNACHKIDMGCVVERIEENVCLNEAEQKFFNVFISPKPIDMEFGAHYQSFKLPLLMQLILTIGDDMRISGVRKLRVRERQYHYHYSASDSLEDFSYFYHNMYLPSMNLRHGSLAVLMSEKKAETFLASCEKWVLIKVFAGQKWVSGGVMCSEGTSGNTMYFKCNGVLDGDQRYLKELAQTMVTYYAIDWAKKAKVSAINMGGALPLAAHGIFLNKKKFGPQIVNKSPECLYLQINMQNASVKRFLIHNPLIVFDNENQCRPVIFVDKQVADSPFIYSNMQDDNPIYFDL